MIYVEPEMGARLAASSSRSELKFDGEPLPWGRWAEEFAAKLPDEIRKQEDIKLGFSRGSPGQLPRQPLSARAAANSRSARLRLAARAAASGF